MRNALIEWMVGKATIDPYNSKTRAQVIQSRTSWHSMIKAKKEKRTRRFANQAFARCHPEAEDPQPERLYKAEERNYFNKNFILSNSDKKFLFSSLLCFMSIGGATLVGGAHKSPINTPGAHVRDLIGTGPVAGTCADFAKNACTLAEAPALPVRPPAGPWYQVGWPSGPRR